MNVPLAKTPKTKRVNIQVACERLKLPLPIVEACTFSNILKSAFVNGKYLYELKDIHDFKNSKEYLLIIKDFI